MLTFLSKLIAEKTFRGMDFLATTVDKKVSLYFKTFDKHDQFCR